MFRMGIAEILVILLIVLLLFGAKRLPEIGRALAKTLREFRKESECIDSDKSEEESDDTIS
ncbi:MAG: twin-arginine translocase TatA/TatE family subunit [Candidatus Kaelpia aquatica]|nr:twin-arginine translocase TatA/TatE family subunit [Candidatus Kaelpia aquatica]